MIAAQKTARFPLGAVVATPGALEALESAGHSPAEFLSRHAAGDWGELESEEDKRLNDDAVANGERILSVYRMKTGEKIWIITEADRSATTILLPSEY